MSMEYFSPEFSRQSPRAERLAKRQRRRRIIAASFLGLILVLVLASALWIRSLGTKMALSPGEAADVAEVVKTPKSDQAINVLLVGTDSREANGPSRADSIMVLRLDQTRNASYLLSIARDTRVYIPGKGKDKINHAWAFGGAPLLIRTVSGFLDIDIHYFLKVDFVSFAKIVDAMGGVRFATDRSWYDGEIGAEVRQGNQLRMGKEALALVRARKQFPGGDYTRMENQQAFLMAIFEQAAGSYTSWPGIASTLATYSKTNMDTSTMVRLAILLRSARGNLQQGRIPTKGSMIGGVYYGLPDEEAKEEIVRAMKAAEPLPASARP